MSLIAWVVIGGLAGWIASMIAKTNASQGVIMNIIIGIVGAFLGGLIFNALGGAGITGFNLYSLVVAIFGSVVLLGLTKMIAR